MRQPLEQRWLRWAVVATLAVGLVALGYVLRGGGSSRSVSDERDVRTVVKSFAHAADARACDLLTEDAVERIYGGKRRCVERSGQFRGGEVRITRAIVGDRNASVKATTLDGRTLYTVRLQKMSPGCRSALPGNQWLISSVKSQPNV
jgi:hypothetical protein